MKNVFLLTSLLFICFSSFSQLSSSNKQLLKEKEDKMKPSAIKMINASIPEERLKSDSLFTREFVQALKTPYSFNYTFDSLYTVSQLYAPDSVFKIFTWQLVVNDYETRQHGAIQMRTD